MASTTKVELPMVQMFDYKLGKMSITMLIRNYNKCRMTFVVKIMKIFGRFTIESARVQRKSNQILVESKSMFANSLVFP